LKAGGNSMSEGVRGGELVNREKKRGWGKKRMKGSRSKKGTPLHASLTRKGEKVSRD